MELKQIKELMTAMGRTGTKRLTLKKDDFELVLERAEQPGPWRPADVIYDHVEDNLQPLQAVNRATQALARGAEMPTGRMSSSIATEPSKEDNGNSQYITSPMVGTFYASPSPEDPTFVKIGDKIDKNAVVCIIEAMKVMNEIKANIVGTVAEMLVESGQPVEFGTKLFRIVE